MKLGLRLPQRTGVNLQHDVVDAARTAEAAGYESLWTYERLLYPVEPKESYMGAPGLRWPEHQRQAADSLAVLTAAAVVTTKARLGTGVLVAALHAPVQLAKSLATVDQISGGRLIAGLGSGWSTDELQATGATRADRGRFLDETFDVFEAVWGPDPVSYRGSRAVIEKAFVLPKPVSRIPVMLGGGSPQADRIARRADGWLPVFTAVGASAIEAHRATWNRIRDLAAEHGRDPGRLEHIAFGNITFTDRPTGGDRSAFVGTLDQIIEDVAAAAEAGVQEVIIDLNLQDWFTDTQRMLQTAQEIQTRVTAAGI